MQGNEIQHVFLVGAKSLGAYGGYETFVNKLTEYHQDHPKIRYHVACKANGEGSMDPAQIRGAQIISDRLFLYHNAHCFRVKIPEKIGPAQAIYYDVMALSQSCRQIRKEKLRHPVVYIMACRIGPFMRHYCHKIHRLGGRVYLNPDGHEFLRAKWSWPVRKYWKLSERLMVRWSDLDQKGVRGKSPRTTYIAYGAETRKSKLAADDRQLLEWYARNGLQPFSYYLAVGRFVPENNYETIIREFMSSRTRRDLAIITNVNKKFLDELERRLHFLEDKRIKFVGTVYDQELLMKIRENAWGSIHGHEVGGTNPSLLEALGSTSLNLLLDVKFNREVAEDSAFYWKKQNGNLASWIDRTDQMSAEDAAEMGRKAKGRVVQRYTWNKICAAYEAVFCEKDESDE